MKSMIDKAKNAFKTSGEKVSNIPGIRKLIDLGNRAKIEVINNLSSELNGTIEEKRQMVSDIKNELDDTLEQ